MSPKRQFAQIQFHGVPGITQACVQALVRLIHFGDRVSKASVLTCGQAHCFLLTVNEVDQIAIGSGFSSGYSGEGPRGLATALQILNRHGAEIEEYLVGEDVIKAIDDGALSWRQLQQIESLEPYRPMRWYDYIYAFEGHRAFEPDHRRLNGLFPCALPYALIDPRIMDLALSFPDNPDAALVSAYRRLEDLVREKSNLPAESSARLFSRAFQGDAPILVWDVADPSEQRARATLFDAVYRAYRNPRAHKEPSRDLAAAVREFLLLNQLFLLEGESKRAEMPSAAEAEE